LMGLSACRPPVANIARWATTMPQKIGLGNARGAKPCRLPQRRKGAVKAGRRAVLQAQFGRPPRHARILVRYWYNAFGDIG